MLDRWPVRSAIQVSVFLFASESVNAWRRPELRRNPHRHSLRQQVAQDRDRRARGAQARTHATTKIEFCVTCATMRSAHAPITARAVPRSRTGTFSRCATVARGRARVRRRARPRSVEAPRWRGDVRIARALPARARAGTTGRGRLAGGVYFGGSSTRQPAHMLSPMGPLSHCSGSCTMRSPQKGPRTQPASHSP